ncbi:hydrogenase/urease maturation nickel metallochaperone HypA [Methanimicrococcus blatticola]|uniref:Hydrogenase maturation factor HypA n=1 Tax=Methanimicrococcus blatticola TaxID=91560 RepID=A0A484F7P6_9EURY|nr:hydrogenase/urease maturation nickel metallochaperone HypA [Methanimicrococcus blatticola]MBZ3934874.1 hydrogenase maturation nickel metallochaperone HypA [Methanimicrococcus blatticola]MCC2509027.1 hydrogenase/urease maturation nickel metallochaperone HypA [Methanimicrococcus blatticola]TDQ70946.1 hydrogenase nickel incorporation protein HypA/HybF [Methanimicrococcus blatticola]
MHEYSLAMDLMESVLTTAEDNNAKIVNRISVKVGRIAHVNPMQLEFCLKSIGEGTIAENASYSFEYIDPEIKCACGYFGKPDETEDDLDMLEYLVSLICPLCGKNVEVIGGTELVVDSIDID